MARSVASLMSVAALVAVSSAQEVCKASCNDPCARTMCEELATRVATDAAAATTADELQAVWDAATNTDTYKVSQSDCMNSLGARRYIVHLPTSFR